MANVNAPNGLVPIRTLDGSCITTSRYKLATANSAIGIGDLVVIASTGRVNRGAAGAAAGTVVGVAAQKASASDGSNANTFKNDILVYDNPMIVYQGQIGTAGSGTAQTAVGLNIDIADASPSVGVSQQTLDGSTAAVTATLPFKILRLYSAVDNAFGANNRLEVCFNKSITLGGGDGSTGI